MIAWASIFFNSLWIFGLSLILAAFSYQHWLAGLQGRKVRDQLRQGSFPMWGWTGLALVTAGLAGTSESTWETVLWLAFTLLNGFFALQNWREKRLKGAPPRPE